MPIKFKKTSDFKQTKKYLNGSIDITKLDFKELEKICDNTIKNLYAASPSESIAKQWTYEIVKEKNSVTIFFNNTYVLNGLNIALLVDKGHATKSGRWVQGKHYIDGPIDDAYNKIIRQTKEELNNL